MGLFTVISLIADLFTVLSMIGRSKRRDVRLSLTAQQLAQLTTIENGARTIRPELRSGLLAMIGSATARHVVDETLRGVGQIWRLEFGPSGPIAREVIERAWRIGEVVLVSVDAAFITDQRAEPTLVTLSVPGLAARLTAQDGGRFAVFPAPVARPKIVEVEA